jgi:hypothetical protein
MMIQYNQLVVVGMKHHNSLMTMDWVAGLLSYFQQCSLADK